MTINQCKHSISHKMVNLNYYLFYFILFIHFFSNSAGFLVPSAFRIQILKQLSASHHGSQHPFVGEGGKGMAPSQPGAIGPE